MRGLGSIAAAVLVLLLANPDSQALAEQQDGAFKSAFGKLFSGIGDEFNRIAKGTTRKTVNVAYKFKPGEIIVSTKDRRLYYVIAPGRAYRYSVGVGREGFQWGGVSHVSRKAEWPDWRPPKEMLERQPELPEFMPGGLDNPLGARALYLGSSLYRIHGTRSKHTIGQAISSGCIRMLNDDVIDLYDRVKVGAKVYVYH
ncbi:MAG: L,D-transpeptidase [Hyphomicrobiales bacterium]